jgi:hypothetical protein
MRGDVILVPRFSLTRPTAFSGSSGRVWCPAVYRLSAGGAGSREGYCVEGRNVQQTSPEAQCREVLSWKMRRT